MTKVDEEKIKELKNRIRMLQGLWHSAEASKVDEQTMSVMLGKIRVLREENDMLSDELKRFQKELEEAEKNLTIFIRATDKAERQLEADWKWFEQSKKQDRFWIPLIEISIITVIVWFTFIGSYQ